MYSSAPLLKSNRITAWCQKIMKNKLGRKVCRQTGKYLLHRQLIIFREIVVLISLYSDIWTLFLLQELFSALWAQRPAGLWVPARLCSQSKKSGNSFIALWYKYQAVENILSFRNTAVQSIMWPLSSSSLCQAHVLLSVSIIPSTAEAQPWLRNLLY